MRCVAIPSSAAEDHEWVEYLLRLGFVMAEAIAIVALACDALRWSGAGSDPHFIVILVEAHASTWFSVEGLSLLTCYAKGVPAGTSLADLVFCAGCSRLSTAFRMELSRHDLLYCAHVASDELNVY